MKALFVELPAFERHRERYLDDAGLRALEEHLMANPEAGRLIPETGGLRKLRFVDPRRGKGKRGGLRIIYSWWRAESQFWLFTAYDKDEASDLTGTERRALGSLMKSELAARRIR